MTTFATRSPLQILSNTHAMSEISRTSRRTSARLAEKEDAPVANGVVHAAEKGRSGQGSGKHNRVGVNGTGSGAVAGKAKRKHEPPGLTVAAEYDEDDDGFTFTRTRSKKAKAAPPVQPPETIEEESREDTSKSIPKQKSRRRLAESPGADRQSENKESKRRRSARNSGDKIANEQPLPQPRKRRSQGNEKPKADSSRSDEILPVGAERDESKGARGREPSEQDNQEIEPSQLVVKKRRPKANEELEPKPNGVSQEHETAQASTATNQSTKVVNREPSKQPTITKDTTRIALPFADTPIIRRNKEMRKGAGDGHRRSSLGQRGRRASSLIDGGKSNALPHDEVHHSEFYKHIESDALTEPRRMRQLLMWCGARAMGEKPSFSSEDSHARLAAREIQQQLLKDFSSKSELSDWFSREDTNPEPQPPQPNPKNVSNLAKIEDLQQKLSHLQSQRQTLESLFQPPSPNPQPPNSNPPPISPSLLASPTQSTLLQTLLPPSNSPTILHSSTTAPHPHPLTHATTSRLQSLAANLEFAVDTLDGNVHALGSYVDAADRVADGVLSQAARLLEERSRGGGGGGGEEEGEGRRASARELLRGLSRVLE